MASLWLVLRTFISVVFTLPGSHVRLVPSFFSGAPTAGHATPKGST